jgi:hypothetical protein
MESLHMPGPEVLSESKRKLLERYAQGKLAWTGKLTPRITPRPTRGPAPVTVAQRQIWNREQAAGPGEFPHNECITIRSSTWLDVSGLEKSLAEIVRRHEIWRTNYIQEDSELLQVVQSPVEHFPLPVFDLRTFSKDQRQTELLKLTTMEVRQPFDLDRGPLVRAMLVRMAEDDHRLIIFAHLSVVDGVSAYQILPTELAALYKAWQAGKPFSLPELPIQYADYAYWQRQMLNESELTKQLTYWLTQLAGGMPVLDWPRERPAVSNHRGAIRPFALENSVSTTLKQLSQNEGVTMFALLAASFSLLLHSYTGQTDIPIGTLSPSGRKRSEVQGLLGHFLNPVMLRLDLGGNPSFRELLLRVGKVIASAVSYDDLTTDYLVEKLCPVNDSPRSPLFTVAISLQPQVPELGTGWQVTSMDADSGGSMWHLYLAFIETPGGLIGRAQYNPDVIDEATIIQTLEDFAQLTRAIAPQIGHPISKLASLVGKPARCSNNQLQPN